ncbi:PREDICTED: phosphatidylinositol N-acetylglucosaminyltransferase subunit P [Ceratosolen solmsi marchali]|uniref:Phosphatidylinositol N-acetylglucosaminyltransferase subunit P n=1 Tax=Ceratosolen solmsi marchali TaxID=326594 RepID=A0AAJ6VMD1_9HYME|nr:PREDICTED: phosphatidylinositol N-acetylglucosaminyltransferase subunit P [Ceratosolen solmsi marchali]
MSERTPAPYAPRSVYGYAMYIGSNMLLLLYLVWAFVPEEFLHEKLGLTYWPSKYWAVALPVWILTAIAVFAFAIYPAINISMTPNIDDLRTITDEYCLERRESIPGGIPPVSDIPITEVCRKLYLQND